MASRAWLATLVAGTCGGTSETRTSRSIKFASIWGSLLPSLRDLGFTSVAVGPKRRHAASKVQATPIKERGKRSPRP
jgi:hypothetical protein